MGQCYDVTLNINYINERKITSALEEYISSNSETINWDLGRYEEKGITPDTLDGSMCIFLSDQSFEKEKRGVYKSIFDASYGWKPVLYKMFETMAPFIKDGSTMDVWMDEGRNVLVAEKGKTRFLSEAEISKFDNLSIKKEKSIDYNNLSRNELVLHAVLLLRCINRYSSKEEHLKEFAYISSEDLIDYIKSFDEVEDFRPFEEIVYNEWEISKDEMGAYYTPSATNRDYGPSNPWDAPGMSVRDFI